MKKQWIIACLIGISGRKGGFPMQGLFGADKSIDLFKDKTFC